MNGEDVVVTDCGAKVVPVEGGRFFDLVDTDLLCAQEEEQLNEVYVDEHTQLYLIQDGQYLIPAGGQAIVLQDNSDEVVINNLNGLIFVNNNVDSQEREEEQQEQNVEILDDDSGAQFPSKSADDPPQILYCPGEEGPELEPGDSETATSFVYTFEDETEEAPRAKRLKLEALQQSYQISEAEEGHEDTCQYVYIKEGKIFLGDGDCSGENSLETANATPLDLKSHLNLSKVTGRNLITGQLVTLDSRLQELEKQANENERALESVLNKKLVLGRTKRGRKLVGKILEIHKGPRSDNSPVNNNVLVDNDNIINEEGARLEETPNVPNENEGESHVIFVDEQRPPKVLIKKRLIAQETFDYITRTLVGLMDMESICARLKNQLLAVKLVENIYDLKCDSYNKSVSYIYGKMEEAPPEEEGGSEKKWNFSPNSGDLNDIVADSVLLNFSICIDKTGKKSTRVTICPKSTESVCPSCGKQFKSGAQLRRHAAHCGGDKKTLVCNKCPKMFADHRALSRHAKTHAGAAKKSTKTTQQQQQPDTWYECPDCAKVFTSQFGLKRHLSVHDVDLRPFQCSLCLQRFVDQSGLKKHLLVHTGIRAFRCKHKHCSRGFVNQSDLNCHMRVHDSRKQYACDVCGRNFSRYANLVRHSEIHRGTGGLYTCEICGCSYNYISSLTRHVVQNHIIDCDGQKMPETGA